MILGQEKILNLLQHSDKVPKWVADAREQSKIYNALINGEDFQDLLSKIEHIEKSDPKFRARKKYAYSIKDINHRILQPVDNIYSANGGTKQYNINNESKKIELLKKLASIKGNQTLERWLQKNWMRVYHTDPNGVIMLDYDTTCYPVYHSIFNIRNYEPNGQNVEWIILEPYKCKKRELGAQLGIELIGDEEIEVWRVIDDEADYYYIKENDTFSPVAEYKNPFGSVPAIINSDIEKPGYDYRLSPIDNIVEIQQNILRDRSILNIHKFQNGFSLFFRPKIVCTECHGTRKIGENICTTCNGTGFIVDRDITDEIILPVNIHSETVNLPNFKDVTGFVTPDLSIWEQYRNEIKYLSIWAQEVHWGAHLVNSDDIKERTATEIWTSTQPIINRLNDYSDTAQYVEWQLTEWIANYIIPNKNKDEKVSTISYGRRYIIEPPDVILNKYQEAKNNKLPVTVLDRLLLEYIASKYKNDPQTLREELNKKIVEPYPHYTLEEVSSILGQEQAQYKLVFCDWWETLSKMQMLDDAEKLQGEYNKWFNINKINYENSSSEPIQVRQD